MPPPVKAVVATAAAGPALNALAWAALGIGAFFLVTRGLPKFGDFAGGLAVDLAKKGGEELVVGTGDFFKGVFTGADPIETPVTRIALAGTAEAIFVLTAPAERDPQSPLFNPFVGATQPTTFSLTRKSGELVVIQSGGSMSTPAPDFFEIEAAPLAQRFGAQVGGRFTGIVTEPFFGDLGGPSILQAGGAVVGAAQATNEFLSKPFTNIGRLIGRIF